MDKTFPKIKEYPWGYYMAETDHFFFDIYIQSSMRNCYAMFRAGSYLKINGRRYVISYALFHEADYRDKKTAFEAAKEWVVDQMQQLINELQEGVTHHEAILNRP